MIKIIHRVNTITQLEKIPTQYGVEIDLRGYKDKIILNHEPFQSGDFFEDYLKKYKHAFIILNIKEAGIEDSVMQLIKKHNVKKYFLLDVEFPYIYRAIREGNRNIAIRYSEEEPIQMVLQYKKIIDWVWIDTNTQLPLSKTIIKKLAGLKTCLVSPERWGRPGDIIPYQNKMKKLGFKLDAVMTGISTLSDWEGK